MAAVEKFIGDGTYLVMTKQDMEPETNIIIKTGARGSLKLGDTPTGWPIFSTSEAGYEFDLAIEDEELNSYFAVVDKIK